MKYVKATLRYFFAHFPKLMAIAIIPAVVVAFFMEPQGFGLVLTVSQLEAVQSFSDVFFLVFSRNLITRWPYMIFVSLLLILLCISYTMGVVEKHFRVGKFSLRQPFSNINNCFASAFKVFALLVVIYIVYKFLLVCVLTLLTYVLDNFYVADVAIAVVMAIASLAGFLFLLVLVRPIIFAAATMLVYGYYFKDALSAAIKIAEKDRLELNIALIFPFAVYFTVSSLLVILNAPWIVLCLVHTLLIAILVQYVTVYVLIAMFELSGIERRDVRRYY